MSSWNLKPQQKATAICFAIEADYIANFEVHQVDGCLHQGYWIPAERLEEFIRQIVGLIEIISTF